MKCSYRLLIYWKVAGEWPIVEFGRVHDFEGECLEQLFDHVSELFPDGVIDHVDVYVSYPAEPEEDFFFVAGRIYSSYRYRIFDTYVKRFFNRRRHGKKKKAQI